MRKQKRTRRKVTQLGYKENNGVIERAREKHKKHKKKGTIYRAKVRKQRRT